MPTGSLIHPHQLKPSLSIAITLHPFEFISLFDSYVANMGVITYSQEFKSTIAPSRMFKALIVDSHIIIPKIVPEGIKSVEFIEGDGGAGSIKKTNFADGKIDHI